MICWRYLESSQRALFSDCQFSVYKTFWYAALKLLVLPRPYENDCAALGWLCCKHNSRVPQRDGHLTLRNQWHQPIQHFNIYFTHHFIPMDLKPWTTKTTVVTINTLTPIMSSSQDGQKTGSAVGPGKRLSVCVRQRERVRSSHCYSNSCYGSRYEEQTYHWVSMMSPVWRGEQMGRARYRTSR